MKQHIVTWLWIHICHPASLKACGELRSQHTHITPAQPSGVFPKTAVSGCYPIFTARFGLGGCSSEALDDFKVQRSHFK